MARTMSNRHASKRSTDWLRSLRLIGMVHLPALPGSPSAAVPLDTIMERAIAEVRLLVGTGFNAVIVENFGDTPFAADQVPPETVAAMAVVTGHITRTVSVPVGVNVLRNDALAALAVAAVTGAAFIRVNVLSGTYATDQGLISGRARELLQRRAQVAPPIKIAADVHVKHATPISQPDIALAAHEAAYRSSADCVIVSGSATGSPANVDDVRRVREAVPDRPIWIGSGATAETVRDYLQVANAVIVGTCLKHEGETTAALDANRVRAFARVALK
ncbi:MAG TPA: BtpA/SgcQ family protein [Phycisphaerae bacterium]|nr:BtpA/SgcQ family protein [Phycisphaerae bacterium]